LYGFKSRRRHHFFGIGVLKSAVWGGGFEAPFSFYSGDVEGSRAKQPAIVAAEACLLLISK